MDRFGKMLSSVVLAVGLVVAGPTAAIASSAPHHVMIADQACNQGTLAARTTSGNGIVPMYMATAPVGCMTMPGAFQP